MPPKANLQQRITRHIAHAAECGCRDMPESVKQALNEPVALKRDNAPPPMPPRP